MVIGHMSRGKMLRRSIIALIVLIAFSYGTVVGQYQLFPFAPTRTTVKYIGDLKTNLDELSGITIDYSADSNSEYSISPFTEYDIETIEYDNDVRINNFDIY